MQLGWAETCIYVHRYCYIVQPSSAAAEHGFLFSIINFFNLFYFYFLISSFFPGNFFFKIYFISYFLISFFISFFNIVFLFNIYK